MALATKIFNLTRQLYLRVWVDALGGSVLLVPRNETNPAGQPGITGLSISKSFDAPVPVCRISLNRIPTWMHRGQRVRVNLGFDGEYYRVFTGTIQARERDFPGGAIICDGRLYPLFHTPEIGERDLDGLTVTQALGNILAYVGITDNRLIFTSGFVLGSAPNYVAKLERMMPSQMLQYVMDLEGLRVYELGTGKVVIRRIPMVPAATSWRTYTTNVAGTARIIRGTDREDPEQLRTRVLVTGATVVEGTPPNETSRVITASASVVDNPLVQPPLPSGTFIDEEYSNSLIDTDAKAAEVALRLLSDHARVPRELTIELPGDPQIELGVTIHLDFAELDAVGNFLVISLSHDIDSRGFSTTLRLRGGDELGGEIGLDPDAAFRYEIEREVFGDRVYAFATFDASESQDRDGSIASYAWSDNQAASFTNPQIDNITTKIATVRVDPAAVSGDWEVTLTVTDDSGRTNAVMQVIPIAATESEVHIPAIFAALDNNASATPDGGENWNDEAGSTCICVAARPNDGVNSGHAVYGFADGSIKRTTDYCQSIATVRAAGGAAIQDIAWDWRNASVVWALTDDLIVYISTDGGATWATYDNVRTKLGLGASATGRKIGLPGGGGVWVFGGDGANRPVIAYDPVVPSLAWTQLAFGGELTSDLPAASASLRIVDALDKGDGSGLVIVMENADGGASGVRPVYHCDNPFQPSTWKRATGLDAGLTTGRYVVGDNGIVNHFHAAFNNRDVWHSLDGITWTKTADVMPVGVTPNKALWYVDPELGMLGPNVWFIAAED